MKNAIIVLAILICSLIPTSAAPAQQTPTQSTAPQSEETPSSPKEPSPELERPSVWGEPTEVKVTIYVIDVDLVNSAEQNFSASVFYEAHWSSPILRHKGPGPLIRRTTGIWTPRLTIINQQQAWPSFPAAVEISPGGDVVLLASLPCREEIAPLEHTVPLNAKRTACASTSPAMAAGVTKRLWEMGDVVDVLEAWEATARHPAQY